MNLCRGHSQVGSLVGAAHEGHLGLLVLRNNRAHTSFTISGPARSASSPPYPGCIRNDYLGNTERVGTVVSRPEGQFAERFFPRLRLIGVWTEVVIMMSVLESIQNNQTLHNTQRPNRSFQVHTKDSRSQETRKSLLYVKES